MSTNDPVIDPSAKIGSNVEIGPWTIIGPEVEIGDNCKIASHVVIRSHTRLGKNNQVFQFASVGEDPSDMKYHGEISHLEIGDNNIIREGATIHRGTEFGGGLTRIGSDNLFMPYTHVAHDCMVGNHTIFSNNAAISGHVEVGDWAILAGYAGVYQFLKIGAHSFVGGLTHVNMDVPAYVIVNGNPPSARGINSVGLERRGFSKDLIRTLRQAYKILYRDGKTTDQALEEITTLAGDIQEIRLLIDSVKASSKGITR
ncbi:MAG: acyl-[acyl-carrier-protein]--UDP-N-acetylglucosamine O-acyltransferase [Gammaproteobacteria bacterium]|mgnify:FL=1|nr:acyl-[acyl-carrier-protein]--UDP-N-acetylglucosamine O-acyltransferase [Gammaproteobacteria bacterium]MAY03166.1 acyl-[acyl-carrier-protein]--UDP-N-acetylglucosamine O-acyltransferase [Gammaproteobacteria bacterium]|tara:strand:+ start:239 stop:1009 length:771 start_codon:yes stop_codon:yes gene_type:complete